MKILPEHFEKLSQKINEIFKENPELSFDKFDWSERCRWNLFHKICDDDHYAFYRELTVYLTDDQIDTALRKITGTK
jgi:hypothetical protein